MLMVIYLISHSVSENSAENCGNRFKLKPQMSGHYQLLTKPYYIKDFNTF